MRPFVVLAAILPTILTVHFQTFDHCQNHVNVADIKVQVQLGVMSRCRDPLLCESRFNEVLDKVAEKVELSFIYVAK
jgi:hypothetical protein